MTTTTPIRWKELSARERDALIAVHLFGWEWMGRDNVEYDGIVFRRAIYGPPPYVRFNYSDEIYRPATESDPLFSDWDSCCGLRGQSGHIEHHGMPRYTSDISDAFQVVEKMREKGFGIQIVSTRIGLTGYRVEFGFNAGFEAEADTLPEAICLAALTAIGLTIERE